MEPDDTNLKKYRLLSHVGQGRWIVGALLLLLVLAGCLTSHAAGPPEWAAHSAPSASATPTLWMEGQSAAASATRSPAITLIPNMAVRAFQTTTPTVTTTPTTTVDTPTPTLGPTDTPQPTATASPTDTPRPTATATPRPTTARATTAPFQAYAWVDNFYPAPGSVVTVHGRLFINGRPVNGAQMGATWSYTHGEGYCTAYTGIDGRAACSQNIGGPLPNYWVFIDVVFIHKDELYYAKTGFLTDP